MALGLGLVLLAVALRAVGLSHWPGINGDEAWYGVQLQQGLAGNWLPWRTPSGNLIDPFYFLLLLPAEWLAGPSFVALRWPALAAGLLLLGLAWRARRFADTAADLWLPLLAFSPVLVLYSRLGWDPALTPLASAAALLLAWRGRGLAAALATWAAALVHPANLFLIPLLFPLLLAGSPPRRRWQRSAEIGVFLLPALLSPLFNPGLSSEMGTFLAPLRARLLLLPGWREFAQQSLDLFSGWSSLAYLAGRPGAWWSAALRGASLVALLLGLTAVPQLWRDPDRRLRLLLCGWLLSWVLLYLTSGTAGTVPHQERYALFLVVPGLFLMAQLLNRLPPPLARGRSWITAAICLFWIAALGGNFFRPLQQNGGNGPRPFRSAAREPKEALWHRYVALRRQRPAPLVAETWWLYWPLRYLARGQVNGPVFLAPPPPVPLPLPPATAEVYLATFSDGPVAAELRQHGRAIPVADFPDAAGRPLLTLWRDVVAAPAAQSRR